MANADPQRAQPPISPALHEACALARTLVEALDAEIVRTERAQQALARIDTEKLFAYATERDAFHTLTAALEARLGEALSRAAAELGLSEVTIASLVDRAPIEGAELDRAFAEIRRRASALDELNKLHRALLERSLAVVSGYVAALQPRAQAYDRRGGLAGRAEPQSTFSRRA